MRPKWLTTIGVKFAYQSLVDDAIRIELGKQIPLLILDHIFLKRVIIYIVFYIDVIFVVSFFDETVSFFEHKMKACVEGRVQGGLLWGLLTFVKKVNVGNKRGVKSVIRNSHIHMKSV